MLENIDRFALPEIAETITLVEGKLVWMRGHHHLQWQDLRRRLLYELREREQILSRNVIPIPVPDPHIFRALTFEVSPIFPRLTFEFNSGVRNGARFNITIGSDRESLRRDLGVIIADRRGGDRGFFGTTKIEGTLLFMVHSDGIGLQMFFGNKAVVTADKLLNYRTAPTVEIRGYQESPSRSVIKDLYSLTPHELCTRCPALKADWVRIQIKIAGKSFFDERGYWIPPQLPEVKNKKLVSNPRKWGRKTPPHSPQK